MSGLRRVTKLPKHSKEQEQAIQDTIVDGKHDASLLWCDKCNRFSGSIVYECFIPEKRTTCACPLCGADCVSPGPVVKVFASLQ